MLTKLDTLLYPDNIDVIHNLDNQRYVYPIFKCGYSSIVSYARYYKFPFIKQEQIKECDEIDVIIRNPQERFISGVNTYFWDTTTKYPDLDPKTIFHFIKQYPFFNRHYQPQLGWLINLFRFMNPESKVRLLSMNDIKEHSTLHIKDPGTGEKKVLTVDQKIELHELTTHQLYIKLDQRLVSMIGHSWRPREIFNNLMIKDAEAYFECVAKNQVLAGVTDVLPKV